MSKQIHIRLEDSVYKALSEYNTQKDSSIQNSINVAITQLF